MVLAVGQGLRNHQDACHASWLVCFHAKDGTDADDEEWSCGDMVGMRSLHSKSSCKASLGPV